MKTRLFTPGPTQVPNRAFAATADALLHPRSEELRELLTEVSQKLKAFFKTEHEVLTLTASGTGAMEAAVVNFLRHGEKVITLEGGKFGQRWSEIARLYGLHVVSLELPWGSTIESRRLSALVRQHPDAAAVFLTHCETSTGVAHDIEALAAAVHQQSDALVIVDGISAVGILPFYKDQWAIDVCVAGSQKGAMSPPGLAFVAISERGWRKAQASNLPRYYFDFLKARDALADGYTPWTPAVTLLGGLRESLSMILDAGLERCWERYARLAHGTHVAVEAIGLQLFAKRPSDSLTAVKVPDKIDGRVLVKRLLDDYGVRVAGGQDQLKGKIFRVAHMGYTDHLDMIAFASALELALRDCGWPLELGTAVAAMQVAYAEHADSGNAHAVTSIVPSAE
ncbi:MAG: pyridoxal-phosphate-dependent aminotransferase family protein [Acidiferrobacterales bacterium]